MRPDNPSPSIRPPTGILGNLGVFRVSKHRVALAPDASLLDPDLEALPEPRRPWRRLTLVIMPLTACCSALLAWSLGGAAVYATATAEPLDLGTLTDVQLDHHHANQWARGRGELGQVAVEFRRPLDTDLYRVAPVARAPKVWVQLRVPSGFDADRYVAPNSFVGRLVPFDSLGLRHAGVREAVEAATHAPLPEDAWLLMDGEAPQTSRWVLGVVGLLVVFVVTNVLGTLNLLRPVRDA